MIKVKVLKYSGETGLRNPGTCYFETTKEAERLSRNGFVEIVKDEVKEEKTHYETKEEKHTHETKRTRKKRK